jgi:hypothetical protein
MKKERSIDRSLSKGLGLIYTRRGTKGFYRYLCVFVVILLAFFLDPPFTQGCLGCMAAIDSMELAQNVAHVRLHRMQAKGQCSGDLFIASLCR